MSQIEQSIKSKIESVGTPLKDWDISINYGIKTGYNDAFIIDTKKREEILNNCQTDDERNRRITEDNIKSSTIVSIFIKKYFWKIKF